MSFVFRRGNGIIYHNSLDTLTYLIKEYIFLYWLYKHSLIGSLGLDVFGILGLRWFSLVRVSILLTLGCLLRCCSLLHRCLFFSEHLGHDFDWLLSLEFLLAIKLFRKNGVEFLGLEFVFTSIAAERVDSLLANPLEVFLADFLVSISIDQFPLVTKLSSDLLRRVNTFLVHVLESFLVWTSTAWFAHATHLFFCL